MRKAWFKNLRILVLIFLFLSFSSLRSLSAEAAEAVSLQMALTLSPAEAMVPGDRITRQILLENLTDKKLKYSVEEMHCTGTAALLPHLTLRLEVGEQALFSGRADQLGSMSSFPISIPGVHENGAAGGVVRTEAAGEVGLAEEVSSAEGADEATVLKLIMDFSPEAEASLMDSEAEIQLLLSAEEVSSAGGTGVPETNAPETEAAETEKAQIPAEAETKPGQAKPAETETPETGNAEGTVQPTRPTEKEGTTEAVTGSAATEKTQQESNVAEQGKESAAANGNAGHSGGKSSRGVLFGGAISFLGGPGATDVLEAPEDPPVSAEDSQQVLNQEREAAEKKTETNTETKAMDSRLTALLERLRKRQKDMPESQEAASASSGRILVSDSSGLSILVEERGGQGLCIQKAQSIYGGEAVTIYLGEANMKGRGRRIFGALGNLLLWLMILCAIYCALSAYQERRTGKPFFFMGYKPVLILSESMEPTYPKGAIVLVRKQKSEAEPGDVVMFSPEEGSGTYVIHRIVGESEAGFITRGDHNNTEDLGTVAPEQILGTVKGLIWV